MSSQDQSDQLPYPVDIYAYHAWLFDLDGVLTKTAEVHAAAWKQAFDEFLNEEAARTGKTFSPFDPDGDYERYVDGEPREDGVRNFLAARDITLPKGSDDDPPDARTVKGLGNHKNDLVLHVLKAEGVAVYDGAITLVKALRGRNILTAVVSASENTQQALEAAGITELFDACVDGHVVKDLHLAGKPAPDSYLEAARRLGINPSEAVVVEDALAGVEAGRSGSFGLVVGVDHHDYADKLSAHGADVVVTNLAELLAEVPTADDQAAVGALSHRLRTSSHHVATAKRILAHPAGHNIAWHDVVSMLGQLGTIVEEANHRFTVTVGTETETFDRPKGDNIDAQQVVDLRRMLHNNGVTSESLKG